MRKVVIFIAIAVLTWGLMGCDRYADLDNVVNQKEEEYDSHKDSNIESSSDKEVPKLARNIPRILTYQDDNISAMIDQLIYVEYGTDVVKITDEGYKTTIVLNYTYKGKVHHIDLSEFATAGGVERIKASPNGKYIVLELGAGDCNESILIDSINETAVMLEEYDEDTNEKIPMVSVSWKYDDDNVLAYIPAFPTDDEYVELKSYDIKNRSSRIMQKIRASENEGTTIGNIITWKKDYIEIFDGYDSLVRIKTN
ncbi:hypothetical protein [Lutispora thermophila]|uniref:Lipoprotein n=1 Tax=Lutispora thermophila DSM 19022 TaxID=1122184 RepID=A0A1M6I875_9FIRM|nr:hypothetical protein [Lutispora thermophila]SHJ30635.1 hypothetical protein SAMN02745176_03123 [Lutispora thermophila DSM 19022]